MATTTVSPLQPSPLPADSETCVTTGVQVMRQGAAPASQGYELVGSRYSVLNKTLRPGEHFVAESGSMMHMSKGIKMSAFFGGLGGMANNLFSGEDIARVRFSNAGSEDGFVGVTPNQPMAIIVPVQVDSGSVNAKRGAYFAGPESISPKAHILPAASCLACCCGGLPPVIQKLSGSGTGFIVAGGTVLKKRLLPGEEILVDSHSVVAFTKDVAYDVKRVGTLLTCCCGGEGCFNTVLRGPGDVYIQSMAYEKLVDFLVTPLPARGPKGGQQAKTNSTPDAESGAPPASDGILRS